MPVAATRGSARQSSSPVRSRTVERKRGRGCERTRSKGVEEYQIVTASICGLILISARYACSARSGAAGRRVQA